MKISSLAIFTLMIVIGSSTIASAGFMDTFNKANQAIQNTTSTVQNTQNTVRRAGSIIPKQKKQSAPVQQVTPRETTGSLTDKDRAAIEKAKRAWVAAFKAEDWDALVDQYAENAVLLAQDEEAQTGHEAIKASYASDEDTSNEVFETIEINGDANIAYVQGAFSFAIKSKSENTEPIYAAGKYIEIWQKQSDGTWLITHDIWNANPAKAE